MGGDVRIFKQSFVVDIVNVQSLVQLSRCNDGLDLDIYIIQKYFATFFQFVNKIMHDVLGVREVIKPGAQEFAVIEYYYQASGRCPVVHERGVAIFIVLALFQTCMDIIQVQPVTDHGRSYNVLYIYPSLFAQVSHQYASVQ